MAYNVLVQSAGGGSVSVSLVRSWTETSGSELWGYTDSVYEEYTITATPDTGSSFVRWIGEDSQGGTPTVTPGAAQIYTVRVLVRIISYHDKDNPDDVYINTNLPYTFTAYFHTGRLLYGSSGALLHGSTGHLLYEG